jgi:hypothetical protein
MAPIALASRAETLNFYLTATTAGFWDALKLEGFASRRNVLGIWSIKK